MNVKHWCYPKGVFTDVRIETVRRTILQRRDGQLTDVRTRAQQGAFVRIFDGVRWYMSGFTNLDQIQSEMNHLNALSSKSRAGQELLVKWTNQMNFATGQIPLKDGCPVFSIDLAYKQHQIEEIEKVLLASPLRQQHELFYTDFYVEKRILNSLGGDVSYDKQGAGLWISADFKSDKRSFSDRYVHGTGSFESLMQKCEGVEQAVELSEQFARASEPITPAVYEVILAPAAAGLFAHESVGHLGEADFSANLKPADIGKFTKPKNPLKVVDDGGTAGWGYTPFDDEGMPSRETLLVEGGFRKQRMHTLDTAWRQGAKPTGNGRAVDYSFEPMVRMTNTFIQPGEHSLEAMIKSVTEGVLIENVAGGFGMETFTLTPIRCWRIKQGQVQGPATASVVTGSVEQAIADVTMVSNDFEMHAMVKGGCGKMDQFPLDVGFGGPHVKVEALQIW